MFQTDYTFTLPKGYVDTDGNLHKDGIMRLATAADEILPLKDPRVMSNQSYLVMILLSRVVTSLGEVSSITPKIIEGLFVEDLAYLENMYNSINGHCAKHIATCPNCKSDFEVENISQGE